MSIALIKLTKIGDKIFTFNCDDYMKIRTEYRIIGSLVGCVVSHPRNGNFNGLPAIFSRHEVRLLVEKNLVTVVDKLDQLLNVPTLEMEQNYKEYCDEQVNNQAEYLRCNKIKKSQQLVNKIIEGKRQKLLRSGHKIEDIHLDADEVINKIKDSYESSPINTLVQIPTSFSFIIGDKPVLAEVQEDHKYRVFKDLWHMGFCLTPADSFGGDFLAYLGDPMQYHASHIVHVLESPEMSSQLLVGKGRLSVAVNKICLLAFSVENEISYQTIHWDGRTEYSSIN